MPIVSYSRGKQKAVFFEPVHPPLGALNSTQFRAQIKEFHVSIGKDDWFVMLNSSGPGDSSVANILGVMQKLLGANPLTSSNNLLNLIVTIRKTQPNGVLGLAGVVQRGTSMAAGQKTYEASSKMRKCGFCENMNEKYRDTCSVCGEPLGKMSVRLAVREDEFPCPECKGNVRRGSRTCSRCGAEFCGTCKVRVVHGEGAKQCAACQDKQSKA
jgi:hypothetical protein